MRSIHSALSGLGLLGSILVVGCAAGGAGEGVGTSEARITLATQGHASTSIHLTATNEVTSEVVTDQSVHVAAGGTQMVDLHLDPSVYTIHVDSYADEAHTLLLGSGEAHADLKAQVTTEIILVADTDSGSHGGASKGSVGVGMGAGIGVNINDAPQIMGVEVHHSAAQVTITANVTDSSGGELTFFWSGFGLHTAMQGADALTLTASSSAWDTGSEVSHLIVQNQYGASTSIDVDLSTTMNGVSCVFCGAGTTTGAGSGSTSGSGGVDTGVQICLQARVQCDLACQAGLVAHPLNLAANADCITSCGLDLATCEAQH